MLVIQSKKTGYNTNISEIENKITTEHDHDKYITSQEFYKLTLDITERLREQTQQAKMIL